MFVLVFVLICLGLILAFSGDGDDGSVATVGFSLLVIAVLVIVLWT
jgi:hypothetical protein